MERIKTETLQLLLLLLLQVCSVNMYNCKGYQDKQNKTLNYRDLICHTDYSRTITCVWSSTHTNMEAACSLFARRINTEKHSRSYHTSCDLRLGDGPALRTCTMDFNKESIFQSFHELCINVTCGQEEPLVSIHFKPVCNIKLNPPGKPHINSTIVSWSFITRAKIEYFNSELQWRRQGRSWTDSSVSTIQKTERTKNRQCEAELDFLERGETYEARVRVRANRDTLSMWSDWSPVASWVSPVGMARATPKLPSGVTEGILAMVIIGAVLALIVGVMLFKNEKVTWVYEKIKGPDPRKSFLKDTNFQNWLGPHLTGKCLLSSMKLDNITSVEVVSTVAAITLSKEAALLERLQCDGSHKSNGSSFSNPSYSPSCPPPPFPLPSVGKLELCASDTPYGSVHMQGEATHAEQDREEEEKIKEMMQLLSKDDDKCAPMLVVSDYEKVENLEVEPFSLQSSGMWGRDAVNRESPKGDGTDADESHKNERMNKERGRGIDFQTLFGRHGVVFGKGSIQISSDYEQAPGLQPASPELLSLDSGVSSGCEEQASHEESREDMDKSTHFPFLPPPSPRPFCASVPSLPLLKFSGTGSSTAVALMLVSPGVEPADDGYLPGDS